MNLDEIVQAILKEVMSQIENKSVINKSGKKALVFFTGTSTGLDESIIQIKKLKSSGINLKAVLSKDAFNILNVDLIKQIFDSENIYIDGNYETNREIYNENFDFLIGANLSINSLAKVANGVADTLPTALISKCILNGTRIIISKDAIDLEDLNINTYRNIPSSYVSMINEYIDRLKSYGIKMVNSIDLFNYVTRENIENRELPKAITLDNIVPESKDISNKEINLECKINKKVISKDDISSNSESKIIVIPSNSIITALAIDLADELGIQIIKR